MIDRPSDPLSIDSERHSAGANRPSLTPVGYGNTVRIERRPAFDIIAPLLLFTGRGNCRIQMDPVHCSHIKGSFCFCRLVVQWQTTSATRIMLDVIIKYIYMT